MIQNGNLLQRVIVQHKTNSRGEIAVLVHDGVVYGIDGESRVLNCASTPFLMFSSDRTMNLIRNAGRTYRVNLARKEIVEIEYSRNTIVDEIVLPDLSDDENELIVNDVNKPWTLRCPSQLSSFRPAAPTDEVPFVRLRDIFGTLGI